MVQRLIEDNPLVTEESIVSRPNVPNQTYKPKVVGVNITGQTYRPTSGYDDLVARPGYIESVRHAIESYSRHGCSCS